MRNKAWTIAPWCLVAVLFFSGAGEAPKPIPEYMQLMLLEYEAQTDALRFIAESRTADRLLSEIRESEEREMLCTLILLSDGANGETVTKYSTRRKQLIDDQDHSLEALSAVGKSTDSSRARMEANWQSLAELRSKVTGSVPETPEASSPPKKSEAAPKRRGFEW